MQLMEKVVKDKVHYWVKAEDELLSVLLHLLCGTLGVTWGVVILVGSECRGGAGCSAAAAARPCWACTRGKPLCRVSSVYRARWHTLRPPGYQL